MAYQVLGLRAYFDVKTRKDKVTDETFFAQRWRFDDIREAFTDPTALLDRLGVPLEERWNLFYTTVFCGDTKRSFLRAEMLPIDIDGLDVTRWEEYIAPVLEVLGIPRECPAIVFSGNGLHFMTPFLKPDTDKHYFTKHRVQYKAIAARINLAFERLRLPGKADTQIFDGARLLRMPGTLNRKPKGETQARVIQQMGEAVDFDWKAVSGSEEVTDEDVLSDASARRLKRGNDGQEALRSCQFLRFVQDNAADVDEPELYATLGILSHFDNSQALAEDVFKPRFSANRGNGGSPAAIKEKLQHAYQASGPRKCKSLGVQFDKCMGCALQGKITSPAQIFAPDVIPTEATGFYNIIQSKKKDGKDKYTPNYDDLLRAFYRAHPYFFDQNSSRIYAFDGKKYVHFDDDGLKSWVESVMAPKPKKNERVEFAAKILANHYRNKETSERFFNQTILNKVNLNNGVFDLVTGELDEHSSDFGFTYVLPYDFNRNAECPAFLKFLDDVTMGRKELQDTLLDFMAYVFVHDYPDHCFLWLTGTGRNGKSTLTDLMSLLVGAENTARVMLDGFDERFQMETMNGKLLNVAEETEEKRIPKKQLSTLKALSAGAPVLVEAKGERPYTMASRAKLVFMANEAPKFGTANQAIKSRLLLVPFDKQLEGEGFSNIDRELPARLASELSGIFNLLAVRLREKQEAGPYRVHRNEISRLEVAELLREGDQLLSWAEDNCELGAGFEMCGTQAFNAYAAIVTERYAGTRDAFSKRLKNLFPGRIKIEPVWNPAIQKTERRFFGIKMGKTNPQNNTVSF